MLIFTDVLTGDEILSDAYDLHPRTRAELTPTSPPFSRNSDDHQPKLVDDVVYEADCSMIILKAGQVDIGANASAEEEPEDMQEGDTSVNNIVYSFRLQLTQFDKKSYMTYLKGYMKAVKAHLMATNPDRVPIFEKNAATFAKKVLGNFGDYEFYTGESMNPDGMIALLNYRADGVTPYFSIWSDGLKIQKV